jgi:membrane associated rhomboid family serine protease
MPMITDEIKASFKNGTSLTKLIYINLGVFVIVRFICVLFCLITPTAIGSFSEKNILFQQNILTYLMLPADSAKLLLRPWTPITYMFLHFDFLHILFNMLWLFWFGRIFLLYLIEKQLVNTYLLGGLAGGLLFILAYNIFPGLANEISGSQTLGASAAVTAIVISVSFYAPNFEVYIPLIGPVKIKYIAILFIVTDLLQIASENAGGHIAHLGGALYGYFFAMQLKRGKDIGRYFGSMMDSFFGLFKRKSHLKVTYHKTATRSDDLEFNKSKAEQQKEIDNILDKIAKSGYDSLSKKEKETLFKMSNKS